MRFGILGPVRAEDSGGHPVTLGGRRTHALLAMLLADAGKYVSADRLIDGMYDGAPPTGAANALQSQVSRLRKQLDAPIEFTERGYRLAVDPDDVDLHRFLRLAEEGRSALEAGAYDHAAGALDEALRLWRGEPEVDEATRANLQQRWLEATEDHVDTQLALHRHREQVPRLRELIAAHPLRERPRAQLVRALTANGESAQALLAYEDARRTLAEELGADPSSELAEAHAAALRDESLDPTRPPAQLTSFVGRAEEISDVTDALAHARLVTLTGPGGAGKTRLAVEVAAGIATPVCFVDLATLVRGADVSRQMLSALGLRDATMTPHRQLPTLERLVSALTDRTFLLILDNCEHVVESAAEVVTTLLANCRSLRVLATSREPLEITGETLYAVPRLAAPPPGTDPETALSFPAVRLFADRAAAARAGFAVDKENVDAVARICAELDGMPLGIELAAARVRSLPVTEIADRLHDRFALLSRGSRSAAARHRTLRAVVEWSWDLLDEDERALAGKLTVFAGGATVEAVEAVCGAGADQLARLVDRSLIELSGDRYRMLETIRAYCAEHAEDTDQRAHATYFLALAELGDARLRTADQLKWLTRLEADNDNLLAALRWAVRSDTDLALRLVAALSMYWWMAGRRSEGAPLAGELVDAIGPVLSVERREDYALAVLNAIIHAPDAERWQQSLRNVSVIATHRQALRRPFLQMMWGIVAGPPPGQLGRDLVELTTLSDDPWCQALEPLGHGLLQLFRAQPRDAEKSILVALERFRVIGERWGLTLTIGALAQVSSWQGRHAEAVSLLGEAIELITPLRAIDDLAEILLQRAAERLVVGDQSGAEADCLRALTLAKRCGARDLVASGHHTLGLLEHTRGNLPAAWRLCEQALRECPEGWFRPDEVRTRIRITLGVLAVDSGRSAADHLRPALDEATAREQFELVSRIFEALAGAAVASGDPERAAMLLGAGATFRGLDISGTITDMARMRLGSEEFERTYAAGRALDRAEALTLTGLR
ncbi:ATP-binding protein [Fodinicola acaciae]|uniref:ATP-binding protein n=1 Tax=Fodinicola acaciae TaxID=2681555 RepID=UPI0013D7ADBC|nr:BTAD domain-containing putative transcriptional regulator [Fodinicola acaciae]